MSQILTLVDRTLINRFHLLIISLFILKYIPLQLLKTIHEQISLFLLQIVKSKVHHLGNGIKYLVQLVLLHVISLISLLDCKLSLLRLLNDLIRRSIFKFAFLFPFLLIFKSLDNMIIVLGCSSIVMFCI